MCGGRGVCVLFLVHLVQWQDARLFGSACKNATRSGDGAPLQAVPHLTDRQYFRERARDPSSILGVCVEDCFFFCGSGAKGSSPWSSEVVVVGRVWIRRSTSSSSFLSRVKPTGRKIETYHRYVFGAM